MQTIELPPNATALKHMQFGERRVGVIHADESCFNKFISSCGRHSFIAMGLAIENAEGIGAIYMAMSAGQAREYAAVLTKLADDIDQGKGKH